MTRLDLESPGGTKANSQGREPLERKSSRDFKPRRGERDFFRPSGAFRTIAKLDQGLAPLAIFFRPSGAGVKVLAGTRRASRPHGAKQETGHFVICDRP